jgi:2-C-methyl-D-erythritol 4-phosphate cytidylyltransferase
VRPHRFRYPGNDSRIVAVILLGAGAGVRLGASVPKAFCEVGGRTLLEHSVERFERHPLVRDIRVMVPAAQVYDAAKLCDGTHKTLVYAGGITRLDSVRVGLEVLADDVDVVLVHDVARPFVPAALIDRVIAAIAAGADAVVPGLAVIDTIKRVDTDNVVAATIDRSELRAVQTPQGFNRAALVEAHRDSPEATDDAGLIEARGGRVLVVEGAPEAFKITTPWDLQIAEAIAATVSP